MNTTHSVSRGVAILILSGWESLRGFSFEEPRMRHGIRENLRVLTPIVGAIKSTLYEIRNEHIQTDPDGKGMKDDEGRWIWKTDGEALSTLKQADFLSDVIEIPFFTIKEQWFNSCWRYVDDRREGTTEGALQRERYFLTDKDIEVLVYAIKYIDFTVEDEEELECDKVLD